VTKTTNIIEINGQRFDALTGVPVNSLPAQKTRQSIDGMMRSKPSPASAVSKPIAKVVAKPVATMPKANVKAMDLRRSTQISKTLMRTSVHKPAAAQPASALKANAANTKAVVRHSAYKPALKTASHIVNPDRAQRAGAVPKSTSIRRFSSAGPVHSEPTTLAPAQLQAAALRIKRVAAAQPAKQAQPSLDIFERALAMATSHEQPTPKSKHKTTRHKRGLRIASASAAIVLVAGFIAWQNVATVKLHMASSRAGFAAALPAYRPAGFSLGKFSYSAGDVAINFTSNTDDRHYALVEKSSDWDSQTLRDSFVASTSGNQYQTVEAGGRTIYVYGKDDATWVNGGVWYQLTNGDALNTRQLVSIATSI
jgi:hypothetical protein